MILKGLVFFLLLVSYGVLFLHQEKLFQEKTLELAYPLASKIQRTVLGYLRQLGGEMLFIKANVFLGSIEPERNPYDYAEPLKQHFDGASDLHPEFIDTYFLCQSSLTNIDPDYAAGANAVLQKAMATMPDNVLWPFFIGFNHYFHLNNPEEAAKYLKIASELPNAPEWYGHLASTLAAKGGNLQTGIVWLRSMIAAEEDQALRRRYLESLAIFEKTASLQRAVDSYTNLYGQPPSNLSILIPQFVSHIPKFEEYEISYTPPVVKLLRPHLEAQIRNRSYQRFKKKPY